MSVTASTVGVRTQQNRAWLHSRDWDLTFITLSVVLVTMPYLFYLALLELEWLPCWWAARTCTPRSPEPLLTESTFKSIG